MGKRRVAGTGKNPPWGAYGTLRSRRFYSGDWRIDIAWRPNVPRLLSDAALARTAVRAMEAAGAPTPASLGIVLSDDEELTDMNREHMDRGEPTDVLSFPMLTPGAFPPHPGKRDKTSPFDDPARWATRGRIGLGDILISVERAVEQAVEGRGGQTGDVRWSPADELRLLVTHGALHICGWDHAEPMEEGAMRALERDLLRDTVA